MKFPTTMNPAVSVVSSVHRKSCAIRGHPGILEYSRFLIADEKIYNII